MAPSIPSTIERRYRIVTLMKQSGCDEHYTAKHTPCHIKVVRRWWDRYTQTGAVDDAKRSGRPRLTGARAALKKLLHQDCKGSAHVAGQLAAEGITSKVVNKTTVIRAAKAEAVRQHKKLNSRRGAPLKGLRQATKVKRQAFARANKRRNWKHVMFTDRKRFYLRYPGSKVKHCRWVLEGEDDDEAVFQPTNPQCVNVYAGITPHGMTAMHVVAGTTKHKSEHKTQQGKPARSITKSEYREVLKDTLLPEGAKLFRKAGISEWFLQQDNDPCHTVASQIVQDWNVACGSNVQLLPNWPPSSPDLNIIENVWALVQRQVNSLGCKDFGDFKQAVLECFAELPQETVASLYNSMGKRMEAVLEREGGYT